MDLVKLSEEDFLAWVAHPGTEALRWLLRQWQAEVQQMLAAGYFIKFPEDAPRLVGSYEVCGRLLTLNFESLMMEVEHVAEQQRIEAAGPGDLSEALRAREEGKLN